jgi:hypothetical protein
MTAWTVIGVLWAVAIGFFFLGWLAARMASQHTRAVESRPECGCSVWPCPTCGAVDWEDAGNKCRADWVCAADDQRQIDYEREQGATPSAPPSMDEGDVAAGLCGNASGQPRLARKETHE